jgi:cobalt-zinc-cadmium resistance protein CzcA
MVRKLIEWSLNNPLVVLLLAAAMAGFGLYAFFNVNIEAYPDPAPAIIEVIAQFPGASAEEVERQVTIPLEVNFAGMKGMKSMRSQSLYGLCDIKMNWEYGSDYTYETCRQEVINRIATISQPLPANVTPQISPESPTGEIYRYVLKVPQEHSGRDVYTLNDIKALQDWVLEREFRTVPKIIDVVSFGGTVRRYEIQPDPDRLRRYGITLPQLQNALVNANASVGGDYVTEGHVAYTVRHVGLFGGGVDPVNKVLGLDSHWAANAILRGEEQRRIRDIRRLVIASFNSQPVRVEDVVVGGRVLNGGRSPYDQGVVVRHQTRLGRVGYWKPERERPAQSNLTLADVGRDKDDVVECIVLMRKNEETLTALKGVKAKVNEINDRSYGRLLPGVTIEPYYDRTDLINVTTETVEENLVLGMALVTVILLMFISNVRAAIIVAINIPLALLFAFSLLFLRGKSANLLSIGAVDFGIIVDSGVIMVENTYRYLTSEEHAELPIKDRILRSAGEITHALFFSTLIMVCAFIPLFTMRGPEGQLFGPMADTYAFALGGALVLAVTLTPVLCMLFFKGLKPSEESWLAGRLKHRYLWQLNICLKYRWATLGVMGALIGITAWMIPRLGTEFMPELEEGNLWIRSTAELNVTLERNVENSRVARRIIASYPEVESIVAQLGRPDDGTDAAGFYNTEYFVPLRREKDWPLVVEQSGWRRWIYGARRARTKEELVKAMNAELGAKLPGMVWNFSQNIRDNVMEALYGVKGDNSVKIFGPDLDKLEELAAKVKIRLEQIQGINNVGIFHIRGQSHLEFRADPDKCEKWGVSTADVNNVVSSALGARALSSMVEGEKLFDISIRWPTWLRNNETSILDIPVDITNNAVIQNQGPGPTPSATGYALVLPSVKGSLTDTTNPLSATAPRLRLRDLVSPLGEDSSMAGAGQYQRSGAADIYREQGKRMIAIKFSVGSYTGGDGKVVQRDLGSAVGEAQEKIKDLFHPPYRAAWSGEFEEMENANGRLLLIVPLSLALVFVLLYMAFRSFVDSLVVFSNVLALAVGGFWSLFFTGTNFSISAAVGFVSLFGVAIMDGLLMISYFNALRAEGLPLHEAIMQGAGKRVRPVTMTALTAILGLLPAAVSTRIGAQTQRPLAIVVVGGMLTTLFLTRYLMPVLYSFYGHREPPAGAGSMTH